MGADRGTLLFCRFSTSCSDDRGSPFRMSHSFSAIISKVEEVCSDCYDGEASIVYTYDDEIAG